MPEPKGRLVTPVGFDANGNLVALLVDADGRLQATIAKDAAGNPIRVLADATGKLITRSNVVFHEDFEQGISAWSIVSGTGSHDTSVANTVAASLKVQTPAVAGGRVEAVKYGLALSGVQKIESWVRFDGNLGHILFFAKDQKDGESKDFRLRYLIGTKELQISEDAGVTWITVHTFVNGLYPGQTLNMWHQFAVTVDWENIKYVSIEVDGRAWDISGYNGALVTGVTEADFGSIRWRVHNRADDATSRPMWIDDVRIYQEG